MMQNHKTGHGIKQRVMPVEAWADLAQRILDSTCADDRCKRVIGQPRQEGAGKHKRVNPRPESVHRKGAQGVPGTKAMKSPSGSG